MTTINLYQNQPETGVQFKVRGVNAGLIFSVFLVIASFALVGILKASVSYLEKKNQGVQEEVASVRKGFSGISNLEMVLDTQDRLNKIKGNLQAEGGEAQVLGVTTVLDNLEKDLNTNVTLSSYEYSGGKVSITFNSNNFNDVAHQIQTLKKSGNFSGMSISDIKRTEAGIACKVDMAVKK